MQAQRMPSRHKTCHALFLFRCLIHHRTVLLPHPFPSLSLPPCLSWIRFSTDLPLELVHVMTETALQQRNGTRTRRSREEQLIRQESESRTALVHICSGKFFQTNCNERTQNNKHLKNATGTREYSRSEFHEPLLGLGTGDRGRGGHERWTVAEGEKEAALVWPLQPQRQRTPAQNVSFLSFLSLNGILFSLQIGWPAISCPSSGRKIEPSLALVTMSGHKCGSTVALIVLPDQQTDHH